MLTGLLLPDGGLIAEVAGGVVAGRLHVMAVDGGLIAADVGGCEKKVCF
jgi:hypothetical protein